MEFKKFTDMKVKPEDGVLITKFLMDIHLANEENVKKIKDMFDAHKYSIGVVPGAFLKIFTSNEKEIAEIENALMEIDELGLKDLFQANLSFAIFKRSFVEKVKFCVNNGIPYTNEGAFVSALYNNEAFGEYSRELPFDEVKTTKELDSVNNEDKFDAEDKEVYNEIVTKLNYLVLANPTDEFLAKVVKNVTEKIGESILRKEYKFLDLYSMIENVMFTGIDVNPVDSLRIEELIGEAFPVEERGLA